MTMTKREARIAVKRHELEIAATSRRNQEAAARNAAAAVEDGRPRYSVTNAMRSATTAEGLTFEVEVFTAQQRIRGEVVERSFRERALADQWVDAMFRTWKSAQPAPTATPSQIAWAAAVRQMQMKIEVSTDSTPSIRAEAVKALNVYLQSLPQ
jgi:hypothetical protein